MSNVCTLCLGPIEASDTHEFCAWASPMRRQHSTGRAAHTARSSQFGCLGPEGTVISLGNVPPLPMSHWWGDSRMWENAQKSAKSLIKSAVGRSPSALHSSSTRSGSPEQWRVYAIEGWDSSRRMETEPQDSEADLRMVRKNRGRPVRKGGEHALPSVLLSVMISPRREHTHDAVAECPNVCVLPAEDIATSTAQNQRGEGVSVINCSVLAEQTLVSWSAGNTNGFLVADPAKTGSPASGGRLGMAPQPRMVETSRVGGVRQPVSQGSLSDRVMDTITEVQTSSTRCL